MSESAPDLEPSDITDTTTPASDPGSRKRPNPNSNCTANAEKKRSNAQQEISALPSLRSQQDEVTIKTDLRVHPGTLPEEESYPTCITPSHPGEAKLTPPDITVVLSHTTTLPSLGEVVDRL